MSNNIKKETKIYGSSLPLLSIKVHYYKTVLSLTELSKPDQKGITDTKY